MPLPVVCVKNTAEDLLSELIPELMAWFHIVTRDHYGDLSRWAREANVAAVLLDIDTEEESDGKIHGRLAVVDEWRKLNGHFVIISLSRSRKCLVERQAIDAGSDTRFRNPVDIGELRLALTETLLNA